MPSPKTPKYKLLLDEGLPPRRYFPKLNAYYNIKHIKHDLNHAGITDKSVYQLAHDSGRLLVVFNTKDFFKVTRFTNAVYYFSIHQSH